MVAEGDRRQTKLALYCKPPRAAPGSADILYSDANVSQWYGAWRDPRLSQDFYDAAIFVRLRFGSAIPCQIERRGNIQARVLNFLLRFPAASISVLVGHRSLACPSCSQIVCLTLYCRSSISDNGILRIV